MSDASDSSDSSGDDSVEGRGTGARALKEEAFAKVLKDMMDKKNKAQPGVLQEVGRVKFRGVYVVSFAEMHVYPLACAVELGVRGGMAIWGRGLLAAMNAHTGFPFYFCGLLTLSSRMMSVGKYFKIPVFLLPAGLNFVLKMHQVT